MYKEWCTGVYREGVLYRRVKRSGVHESKRSGVQECTGKEWYTGVYREGVLYWRVKRSSAHESKEMEWCT
jgi:hypothetical protein